MSLKTNCGYGYRWSMHVNLIIPPRVSIACLWYILFSCSVAKSPWARIWGFRIDQKQKLTNFLSDPVMHQEFQCYAYMNVDNPAEFQCYLYIDIGMPVDLCFPCMCSMQSQRIRLAGALQGVDYIISFSWSLNVLLSNGF
jgi:hypothetical protein